MNRLLMITTGGTLSSSDKETGMVPDLGGVAIAEHMKDLIQDTAIDVKELFLLDSSNIQPEEWTALAACIYENRKDYDGMVVIHGTDTMAYTAAALSFALINIEIPVVLTGSQVSIKNTIADATENLRAALHMAVSRMPGIYIAFNRKIIRGTRASKVRTRSFDAFESIDYPYAAKINSSGLVFHPGLCRQAAGECRLQNVFCPDVFLLKIFPGISPDIFRALEQMGIRAIYVESFGIGGLPSVRRDLAAVVREAVDHGIVVVVGSQCLYEGSDFTIYKVGREALESGAISIDNMTTEAAVTKLMWALGQSRDPDRVREIMKTNLVDEMGAGDSY